MGEDQPGGLKDRVEALELLVESQQATIQEQQETIDSLRADLESATAGRAGGMSRRAALQTGGVLGLLGLGAGAVSADGRGHNLLWAGFTGRTPQTVF